MATKRSPGKKLMPPDLASMLGGPPPAPPAGPGGLYSAMPEEGAAAPVPNRKPPVRKRMKGKK